MKKITCSFKYLLDIFLKSQMSNQTAATKKQHWKKIE